MPGLNGFLTSVFDGSLPNQEFGEVCGEADIVGYKADAGGRKVLFKALAASGATQVAAVAVCPRPIVAGGYEAVRLNNWRVGFPTPLPAGLTAVKPGDKIYLSDIVAGGMTKTAPVGVGKISQVIGYAYYTSDKRRGIGATEDANAMLVDIQPAVTL